MVKVNNTIYDSLGQLWWDEQAGFEVTSLRYSINPLRYGYFKRQLRQAGVHAGRVLDIGCGGGFLAEEFAKDGYSVTGVDPSANTVAAACAHALRNNLDVQYCVGRGESLQFPDNSFDIVACCDVLEHVDDPAQVIREVARTLKPGGVFFFDTINRTPRSKFVMIKLWQDWNWAGFSHPHAHVWEKFIQPGELTVLLDSAGLVTREMRGLGPARNPLAMLHSLWRIRNGRVRAAAIATEFAMRETADLSVSYMGWATARG